MQPSERNPFGRDLSRRGRATVLFVSADGRLVPLGGRCANDTANRQSALQGAQQRTGDASAKVPGTDNQSSNRSTSAIPLVGQTTDSVSPLSPYPFLEQRVVPNRSTLPAWPVGGYRSALSSRPCSRQ